MSIVYVGPEPTERQQRQRDETEAAAHQLRKQGYEAKVTYLVCGENFPDANAAMITISVPAHA